MEQKDGEGKVDLLELIVSGIKGQNLVVAVRSTEKQWNNPGREPFAPLDPAFPSAGQ